MNTPNELPSEEVGFEGPEKNLQVIFATSESTSLRSVSQNRWEIMLSHAKCKILSSISNAKCTAYILSESSLFVYDDRVILKTCGVTPLLLAVDDILEIGSELGLDAAAVLYWRKNFTNPSLQSSIHRSFSTEVEFLEAHFGGYKASTAQIGPKDSDHWYFYYVELCDRALFKPVLPTFEIKMHEVHPEVSEQFFWANNDDKDFINQVNSLIPGHIVDEFFFEPCGYSMNGIHGEDYQTIHITPEDCCSYVSFETTDELYINTRVKEYRVMELFRPASCTAVEITHAPISKETPHIDGYKSTDPVTVSLGSNIYVSFWSMEMIGKHPLSQIAQRRREMIGRSSRSYNN